MGCKDRIGPTDVYIDERLLQCFKYFMGNKDIFQAHNWMKCLGGAKPACTITLGGQRPYSVMQISWLIIFWGQNHQTFSISGHCPYGPMQVHVWFTPSIPPRACGKYLPSNIFSQFFPPMRFNLDNLSTL